MKFRFLFCIVALLINSTVYAQLNITSSSSERDTTYFYKDKYAIVKYDGSNYLLCCADFFRPVFFNLILGSTVDETINSLKQLDEWFANAKTRNYITIKQNDGNNVTLYKRSSTRITMSYGDVDYIGKKHAEIVERAMFEDILLRRKTHDSFDPYYGYFNPNVFSVSLYNIYVVVYPDKYEEINYYKKRVRKLKYNSDDLYE